MRRCYRMLMLLPVLMVPLILALGKGDAAKGKVIFRRCAVCHGSTGEGNEAIGKALGAKIPELGSKEVQSLDDAALKTVILKGKGKMQAVNLPDAEVEDVIAFLRTLKKPTPK
jgi:mono/diheme cytochrome c family protein